MNSKTSLIFAIGCLALAALSPANSHASAAQKGTAWAQVNVPELAAGAAQLRKTPHHGVPSTYYGAGYFSYPATGSVGSVSVTFRVPAIHCKSTSDNEWLLPGIWVYDNTGTLSQQVDLNLLCDSGTILLHDVICIAGGTCATSLAIHPGDLIVATLSETASGTFGQLRNITTGLAESVSGSAAPTIDHSVFVGIEGPSMFGVTNVPTFLKATFTKVQVNGYYLSDWSPAQYNLSPPAGTPVQVNTTALQDNGDQFVNNFVHN
jgi:hypothetical protein